MRMTDREMREIRTDLEKRLKGLDYMALFVLVPTMEHSPEAIRELLDLVKKAEKEPAG